MTATTLADWRRRIAAIFDVPEEMLEGDHSIYDPEIADVGIRDMPCAVCSAPSVGWCVSESIEDGMETLTGWSCCELHIPAGLRDDT